MSDHVDKTERPTMCDPSKEGEEEEQADPDPVAREEEGGTAPQTGQPSSSGDQPQKSEGEWGKTVAWLSVVDFNGNWSNFHVRTDEINRRAPEAVEEDRANLPQWGEVDRTEPPRYG